MPEPIGPAGPASRPRRGGNSSQDEETTRGYLKPLAASGINETSSVKKKAPVQFLVYADDSGEDEDECEAEEEEQKAKRRPSTRGGSSKKKAAASSPAVTVTVVEESPDEDPPAMAKAGFIFVQHLRGFLSQLCHLEICFLSTL